jgi:hypothetical protein
VSWTPLRTHTLATLPDTCSVSCYPGPLADKIWLTTIRTPLAFCVGVVQRRAECKDWA